MENARQRLGTRTDTKPWPRMLTLHAFFVLRTLKTFIQSHSIVHSTIHTHNVQSKTPTIPPYVRTDKKLKVSLLQNKNYES